MTAAEHYARAEELLVEGVEVVQRISNMAEERKRMTGPESMTTSRRDPDYHSRIVAKLTAQMDELGKKAMGIWAQAQVHATLATAPFQQVQVEVLDSVSVEVANAGDLR